MTEERIAYVVTDGCYSDYRISAVFDNEEAAKAYVGDSDDRNGYGSRIERYTLNSTAPRDMAYWWVSVSHPHDVRYERETEETTDDWVYVRESYPNAWLVPYISTYVATAVHPDRDTALKIAHDLLAQLRYEHESNGVTRLPQETA